MAAPLENRTTLTLESFETLPSYARQRVERFPRVEGAVHYCQSNLAIFNTE